MRFVNKIQSAVWWASRPRLYPEAYRTLARKLRPGGQLGATAEEAARAKAWCCERVVSHELAIRAIAPEAPLIDFKANFADTLAGARARQDECSYRMGGGGDPSLLFQLAEAVQATRIIETGVAYGWSSLAFLLSLANRPGSQLVSTDRPYPRCDETWVGCVVPNHLQSQWTLIRQADRESLPRALKQLPTIDLCHYDSDKSRAGRQWGYALLWNALRAGGVFMSDDVSGDLAFHDFCCQHRECQPLVVEIPQAHRNQEPKYAGILVKPESAE